MTKKEAKALGAILDLILLSIVFYLIIGDDLISRGTVIGYLAVYQITGVILILLFGENN